MLVHLEHLAVLGDGFLEALVEEERLGVQHLRRHRPRVVRRVLRAQLHRVLLAACLDVADAEISVERRPVDVGRGEREGVVEENTSLLVLLIALELLLPPLALHILAHHRLDLLHDLRELLRLLVVLLARAVLWVKLQSLAKVAERELGVAHDVELLATLVKLAERVVRRELLLRRLASAVLLLLPSRPLLPQPFPLLLAALVARELFVLAGRLTGAHAALALAVAAPPILDAHVAVAVRLGLPLAACGAICRLPPLDAL
mmetsp:Transcript_20865/g.53284  ORF Transcript_20865/g.53284 Transcript_20865/m.53284 type:complete len:260 (-) Transcript_20865:337-1116(-)